MGRFETEVLTQRNNLKAPTKLSGNWIDRLREHRAMREMILDMDNSVSETYGEQEGTAYNGHFWCTCYHPLFCFKAAALENPVLAFKKRLAKPRDECIITKMAGKLNLNRKHQVKWEIPDRNTLCTKATYSAMPFFGPLQSLLRR
jgi:hypothetical protein